MPAEAFGGGEHQTFHSVCVTTCTMLQ